MTEEIWKDIPDYEGSYQASSLGNIRSVTRFSNYIDGRKGFLSEGRQLKPQNGTHGYYQVDLRLNGIRKHVGVHILIAAAFLGPRPDGLHVCHNNGDRTDNRVSNLRYDTREGNMADRISHGTSNRGTNNGINKLTENDVLEIKSKLGMISQSQLARDYGVCQAVIWKIKENKMWAWLQP